MLGRERIPQPLIWQAYGVNDEAPRMPDEIPVAEDVSEEAVMADPNSGLL